MSDESKVKFLKEENVIRIVPPESDITPFLPNRTWSFISENFSIKLDSTGSVPHALPKKMFGNITARTNKVMKAYYGRNRNTAVLAKGLKGTGKSLLMKSVTNRCIAAGIPIVNFSSVMDLNAQLHLLSVHKGRLLLRLDEFEKVFFKPEWQEGILSFLDGSNESNILTFITVNDESRVDEHLFNRPGRVLYNWEYKGLEPNDIVEVVNSNLEDKTHLEATINTLAGIKDITYDIVSTVVEEMNLHGISVEEAMEDINLKPERAVGFTP